MQKYGLIGYPLGHSFSCNYFNQKFESEKIDAQYLNFEIPTIKDLKEVLKENPELNGLNVTIPYKEQVIPYLDDLDEDARLIGAVNVIKFTKGLFGKTKLVGYYRFQAVYRASIDRKAFKGFDLGNWWCFQSCCSRIKTTGSRFYVCFAYEKGILYYV